MLFATGGRKRVCVRAGGWHCRKKKAHQELDALQNLNSCLSCKYIYFFVLQERKHISWWRSPGLANRNYNWAEILPRTCSSRASNNLLRCLACVPSITPRFSLVLTLWDCPPAMPLDPPFHSELRQTENNLLRKTKYIHTASKFSLIIWARNSKTKLTR